MRSLSSCLCFITALLLSVCVGKVDAGFGNPGRDPQQPQQPIVGILTTPNPHDFPDFNAHNCPTYIQQTYVEWLAQAGIRSVPLRYDMPLEEMGAFLANLNGVLFTGGDIDIKKASTFYTAAEYVVNYTMAANLKVPKDPFVLWGTCQGFQLVTVASALDQSLLHCNYVGVGSNGTESMLPLTMMPNSSKTLPSSPSLALSPTGTWSTATPLPMPTGAALPPPPLRPTAGSSLCTR